MLVELYGMRGRDGRWSWHYTLDLETDRMWKPGLREARAGIIRFKPGLSLGQAECLRDRLNGKAGLEWTGRLLSREVMLGCRQIRMSRDRIDQLRWVRSTITYDAQASTSSRAPLDNRVLDRLIRILAGRSLLSEELLALMEEAGLSEYSGDWMRYVQAGVCMGALELVAGLEGRMSGAWLGRGIRYMCRRCGSSGAGLRTVLCEDCGGPCLYCEQCLGMGKIRSCTMLVRGGAEQRGARENEAAIGHRMTGAAGDLSAWRLSPAQEAAAAQGLEFLRSAPEPAVKGTLRFLIWAVTGAGKTEMIFPLLEEVLRRGGKTLVTTPRKDVVLELKPRLQKAFEGLRVVTLYGGSEDRWESGEITLATTHQLLRFHRAFDLVIIDEIDAFPYHNNPMLEFAAQQVCKPSGHVVLLSATPPPEIQKQAKNGTLPHVRVPVRYHRHPLPVPRHVSTPGLEQWLGRGAVPQGLHKRMQDSLERGAQLFVFLPKIVLVDSLVRLLRRTFQGRTVEGTSSKDEGRSDKVTDFRGRSIDILVTTTILERGVTVPKTDVYIIGADSRLFDEASLVQMAGRAGRSKEDPDGRVVFASRDWTRSQASAIRQIRTMNRIAGAKGYLIGKGEKGWVHRLVFWRK